MGELEVYVALECTVRLYLRAPQRPVEHRCRLTLGSSRAQRPGPSSCVLTVEGEACQRRIFRVTKENITKVVARLGEGSMTVVFKHGCCDSIVIREVIDRGALTLCHKIVSSIWMGVGEVGTAGRGTTEWLGASPVSGRVATTQPTGEVGHSLSASGKRKIELTLKKRYGDTRGSRMLEAAAQMSATTSSFYKAKSPAVESFLPETPPSSSPLFQRPARRNLTLELSNNRRGEGGGQRQPTTPQDRDSGSQGLRDPRRAAVMARKRLPLGDICEQTTTGVASSSELKDYLTIDEPSSREGFANLGNTCYMNAVLQVLLGLEPFAEDLLNQQLVKQVDPQSLCRMMYLLLKSKQAKDSYDSQRIILRKIKSVIESSRPKFSGYRQQDAHELLTQCLDQLKDDSKTVKKAVSENEEPPVSVCPVVRNFECEMCRTITCKRCGKVSEVSEVIYDFALQLPKSVISRPNEQANLQDLLDRFFKSEEVEYKCPECSCNNATMSCRLARLPRVMIIFLKRYGYNTNLSRNSKRIDFIRIPRFTAVGHLCSETTTPPCQYEGPWPRTTNSSGSCCDDKENLPSTEGTDQCGPPRENLTTTPQPGELQSSALGSEEGSRILGKRRGSESIEQEFAACGRDCNVVKKQKVNYDHQVSVSLSSTAQLPASHQLAVSSDSPAQSTTQGPFYTNNPPLQSLQSSMNTGVGSTTVVPNDLVKENTTTNDGSYSQNSVGRDIAAEFDSLFSPEILLKLDNDPQLKGGPCSDALPVKTSPTVEKSSVAKPTDASATSTVTPLPPGSLTDAHTQGVTSTETERPLSSGRTKGNEDGLMHGLFGGVASEDYSKCRSERTPTRDLPPRARASQSGKVDENLEEEDVGLQRAMEESLREQPPSDMELLQRMGLSEEDQLRLALELSMQEQCVEDGAMDQQSSRDTAEPETPTPYTQRPQTYKLVGIVNHIGKASSGGHYISDVCSGREGVWRSYNDSYVTEAREEDIRQRRKGTGYIFFYMHKSVLGSINTKRTS